MKDIAQEFMEFTKYKYLGESEQLQGLPQPLAEAEYDLEKPKIGLPSPDSLPFGKIALIDALNKRRSLRNFSDIAMTMEELSFLLWCTQGVKKSKSGLQPVLRTVPSAGARHAFETYMLINNVEGLRPGLYRYLAFEHKLIMLDEDTGIAGRITACCLGQGMVGRCAAAFFWAAVAERMTWRYDTRGYRYLHLDAGHVCQNLYLAAESLDCGACAIGAYDDDELNSALGLDGERQFIIYSAVVGKR